jgi:NADH:ubiquinone oxidoreductase subunit H
MKSQKYLIVILVAFAFLICNSLWAQRPKVGLVLSGGGAKGISHIGILQAIDSAGLKIVLLEGCMPSDIQEKRLKRYRTNWIGMLY